jgi:DNA-binding MarR family transcriptional regulator
MEPVPSSNYAAVMPAKSRPTPAQPLSPQEEAAWRAFARAVLVIPRLLDGELLEAEGLNIAEYMVLMNLSEQAGRSMRMTDLANEVSLTSSGLTRVVDRLARQELVERVRDEADGRGQLAVLTPAGLSRLKKAYRTHLGGVRRHVMDHLAGLDLAAFTAAISEIAAQQPGPPGRRTLRNR